MLLYTVSGELRPAAPFDFDLTLAAIAATPPLRTVVQTAAGSLSTVVSAGGQPAHVTVFNGGHVDAPRLTYRMASSRPLGEYAALAAANRVRFFLSLDDDLAFFYQLGREDAHFSPVIARLFGYHQVKFPTPFEAACWTALGGLTGPAAAARVHALLVDRLGPRVKLHGASRPAFPDAVHILAAHRADVGRTTMSERRWRSLQAVATAFARIDPLFLREASLAEVEDWLLGIDGVGPVAARFVLVRGLGRMETARLDDPRLRDAYRAAYGATPSDDHSRMGATARHFGPWRGYWAHYLTTDRLFAAGRVGASTGTAPQAGSARLRRRRPAAERGARSDA